MILIKNGCVHNGCGGVAQSDILIDGGSIAQVGPGLSCPGAQVIDAEGCEVLPGFLNALSTWGILGPGWSGDDKSEESNPVTPQMNVAYAFDHDGMNFQRAYTYGVTAAGVAPEPKNVLAGQAGVYKTYGRSPYKMLVRERAAMIASTTDGVKKAYQKRGAAPMTRMGIFALLLEQLEKARAYDPVKNGYDAGCEAMQDVLCGRQPLFVNCAGKSQIEAVYAALTPYPAVVPVLTGAYGLADACTGGVEVRAVMGDHTQSFNPSRTLTEFEKTIPLMEAGAQIAIGCCGDDPAAGRESLLWNALLWHSHGLSAERALEAITSIPARILGVADRLGSIAPGMDADLSIWTANPFATYEARLTHVFLSGENALNKEAYQSCW
ncbi:MAG: amidohydrolase family protein [Eubacteriales bacterium]|nr:amidohydrolase family protein [Eubacteriales bacterium]